MFVLGYIIGLLNAILIFLVLTYFQASAEKRLKIIHQAVSGKGPRPKGAIYVPDEDDVAERKRIIEENKKRGRDTHISELQ